MKPEEVRRRIEECKEQRLTELDLSNSGDTPDDEKLTAIPAEVFDFIWLEKLDLGGNQLSELPDSISRLQNLSQLYLSSNPLRKLPDSITRLQNLSKLDLSDNQLRKLPDSISRLQNLSQLYLSSNPLSHLPNFILNLPNLSELYLSNDGLEMLPFSIVNLKNLRELHLINNELSKFPLSILNLQHLSTLDLSHNQLSELPDSITHLQNLSKLYLSYNQLSELPDSITYLQNLSTLDLSYNQLNELPDCITHLQNLSFLNLGSNQLSELPNSITRLQNSSFLNLRDNPLVNPPIEIAERGIEAIREYFRSKKEEGEDTLYEAKLIIIGEGGAGKTTLARKILDPNAAMPKPEETTKGIDVLEWYFLMNNEKDFRVNIWDFGGQEIYHATHQFFLTKRSLYLLVVDSRKEHSHLDYWLDTVELFSENSPLLVVKNELGDRPVQMDEPQLKGRFANLKESLPTNLGNPQGGSGLEPIKKAIAYYISRLPHIGNSLPKTWIQVREKLEEDERNYISLDQYLQICDKSGYSKSSFGGKKDDNRLYLSEYLHDLGVILHFQEKQTSSLYKTVILKPKWATDAAYKVLDNKRVIQNRGKFTIADLQNIWHDAEYQNMQAELMELMQEFHLFYPLPHAKNTYIAPQLLDANQPKYLWNDSDNLLLRYDYDFMPKGILTRFIVEMHQYIDEPNVWKSGVLLERDHTWAEVIETYDRREIKIRLSGSNKRGFLEVIIDKLDEIHNTFNQLKVKKLIPCNCSVCKKSQNPHFYDLEKLRERLNNQKQNIECDKPPYDKANVLSLIDDIGNRNKLIYASKESERLTSHTTNYNFNAPVNSLDLQHSEKGTNIMTENPSNQPIKVKSAWANGSFYLFCVVVIAAIIGFLGNQLSFPVLCLVIIAVGLLVPIIGALQLKQDDRLKDETFLSLMKIAITGLPFIRKRLEKSLNPADKSKDQE